MGFYRNCSKLYDSQTGTEQPWAWLKHVDEGTSFVHWLHGELLCVRLKKSKRDLKFLLSGQVRTVKQARI